MRASPTATGVRLPWAHPRRVRGAGEPGDDDDDDDDDDPGPSLDEPVDWGPPREEEEDDDDYEFKPPPFLAEIGVF